MHSPLQQLVKYARQAVLAPVLFATCLSSPPAQAEDYPVTEYRVKAAFLYNFSRFVVWPQPIENMFRLCILGNNPFGDLLDPLIGKSVHNNILIIEEHKNLDNIQDCHIVYVSRSFGPRLTEAISFLGSLPILTISDIESFNDAGGIIRFRLADNKVRFDINAGAASNAGLTISSKLLSLATIVGTGQ